MNYIPRDELILKLAAGWKVRRKSWPQGWSKGMSEDFRQTIYISDLIADDWEGLPDKSPVYVCVRAETSSLFAFKELRENRAAFVRRRGWTNEPAIWPPFAKLDCSFDDLFAHDWEVWVQRPFIEKEVAK